MRKEEGRRKKGGKGNLSGKCRKGRIRIGGEEREKENRRVTGERVKRKVNISRDCSALEFSLSPFTFCKNIFVIF